MNPGGAWFLVALNESGVRYLLVGMSAALLQGARGATEDVELWFESIADERIGAAARAAGGFWVTRAQPRCLSASLVVLGELNAGGLGHDRSSARSSATVPALAATTPRVLFSAQACHRRQRGAVT